MVGLSQQNKTMNKKIRIILPTLIIILSITLLSLGICTYLMKENKVKVFKYESNMLAESITKSIQDNYAYYNQYKETHNSTSYIRKRNYLYSLNNSLGYMLPGLEYNDKYFDYASIYYDHIEDIILSNENSIMYEIDKEYYFLNLSNYLNKEEILSLDNDINKYLYTRNRNAYVFLDDNNQVVSFTLSSKIGDKYKTIINDNLKESKRINGIPFFPKRIFEGTDKKEEMIERWKSWVNNDLLNDEISKAKNRIKDNNEFKTFESDSLIIKELPIYYTENITSSITNNNIGKLIFISTYHPWIAAIKDLMLIYISVLFINLLSMFIISKNILDTYNKQNEIDESKSSFVAAMAHELKTPLTIIKGYSESLLEINDKEMKINYLNKIINKTDEMNDIVTEMLDITRINCFDYEIERKELNINDLIKNIINKYDIHFDLKEEGIFKLIGDEKYIEKLLINLIDNAYKYKKENSIISINIDDNSLEIFNEADNISKERLNNIFDLSSNIDNKGFGLYFCKKVADIHKINLIINNKNNGVNVRLSK